MIEVSNVSDFNLHFVSQYSIRSFLVAGRFFDLTTDWERLSCEWYAKHGFNEQPNDRYIGQLPDGRDAIRYHSVDELVLLNPAQLSPTGEMLYSQWLGIKAKLEEHRKVPDVVILPPPPEPPVYEPEPEHEPEPKKDEPAPKKNPSPALVKFGVWFGIASTVAGVVAWFVPAIKPWLLVIVPVVESIIKVFGG